MLRFSESCASGHLLWKVLMLWSSFCLLEISGQSSCSPSPCQNEGTCVEGIDSYTCMCSDDFTGTDCEVEIDRCLTDPCMNGATCTDLLIGFNCSCVAGYTGELCETDIDECADRPCMNSGICMDGINTFTCQCFPGFAGDRCQFRDTCTLDQPCPNNSTCMLDGAGDVTCLCPPDFTGNFCSEVIDDCASMPCQNNGTCTDGIKDYTCTCTEDYTGVDCEVEVDRCQSDLCMNNGTCTDFTIGFECNCTEGFTGTLCGVDVDVCGAINCGNGTCEEGLGNSFTCLCPSDYTGELCMVPLVGCLTMPCMNNATCIDLTAGTFNCSCISGFAGELCETNIDDCADRPCMNSGICIDGVDSFTCQCSTGFIGDTCEVRDTCTLDQPCPSNSTCMLDGAGAVTCLCPPDFTGEFCSEVIDDCAPMPCQNNGTCTDNIGSYTCTCTDNYTGVDCEVGVDMCLSDPCMNNGTCTDLMMGFECGCMEGFSGTFCEVDIDVCESMPCDNNATCTDGLGASFTCLCLPDYTGELCSEVIDNCISMPCQNNGTCNEGTGNYTCTCTADFTGSDCEIEVDMCQSDPCLNNGTCVDFLMGFGCSCTQGFTGELCDTDIDACESTPCVNNGTCSDGPGTSFTCVCPPDYTGETCSNIIDDCASMPCQNNGTCIEDIGNYTCTCTTDFTGTDCQTEVDVCQSDPCMNGGTCIDLTTGFDCTCPEGFNGPLCDADINVCDASSCANGGTCVEGVGLSFTCQCTPQYTSSDCSLPVVCSPPCLNNGTCVTDGMNGSMCVCTPEYEGPDCGTTCPCQNGGVCSIGEDGAVRCNCPLGWTGIECEINIIVVVPSFNGDGYLEYTSLNQMDTTITVARLAFQTTQPLGQLLYNAQNDTTGVGDYIQLRVAAGLLQLRVNHGGANTNVTSTLRVDDDEWHFVEIRIDTTMVSFILDNLTTYSEPISGGFMDLNLQGSLYLGGVAQDVVVVPAALNTPSFIGCISNFEEDERTDMSELAPISGLNVVNCNGSTCQDIVCENGGSCVQNLMQPTCSCLEGFGGQFCEVLLCTADPCQHGSTCVPLEGTGYRCICQLGYTGMNCETALAVSIPQFFNTSYIRYLTNPSVIARSTVIEIDIKPARNFSSGILLYASQTSMNDYFLLALDAGRVIFQFYLDSDPGVASSTETLVAGVWHKIQVRRVDSMASLIVNSGTPVNGLVNSGNTLNINDLLFVGGIPSGQQLPSSVAITSGFDGCIISNFTLSDTTGSTAILERDVGAMVSECGVAPCTVNPCLNGGTCNSVGASISCTCSPLFLPPICNISTPDPCLNSSCSSGSTCMTQLDGSFRCICPFGSVGPNCDQAQEITVPSFNKTDYSYISFPTPSGVGMTTTITMSILPYTSEGLILYSARSTTNTIDFISLAMKDGFLEFRYNLGFVAGEFAHAISLDRLTLGQWHDVYVSRNAREGNLTVSSVGTRLVTFPGGGTRLDLTTALFVGGAPDYGVVVNDAGVSTGFGGCINNLVINGQLYDWTANTGAQDIEQCDIPQDDPCLQQLGSSCQNGGICVQYNSTAYTCQCPQGYSGTVCETFTFNCTLFSCHNGGRCLLNELGQGTICSCPIPYVGENCSDVITFDTPMFGGQSYIEIRTTNISTMTSFSLEFRTSFDGLIFWQGMDNLNGMNFISLGVVRQRLELRFNQGLGAVLIVTNAIVSDGEWHNVTVLRNNGTAFLTLDNMKTLDVTSPYALLETTGNYWIGGHEDITITSYTTGLMGCIRNVTINEQPIDLADISTIASSSNVLSCEQ